VGASRPTAAARRARRAAAEREERLRIATKFLYSPATLATRMILLIGFYEDPAPPRMREFLTCLERNLANALIREVHAFVEEPGDSARFAARYAVLRHPKLRLVEHGRRATYRDLFDHANRSLAAGQRGIIANADIYFDHTLARFDDVDLAGRLACLSRWDVLEDGSARLFEHPSSQDAWIFQAPVPPIACRFHLGVLGCDNRLAWEAQAAGLAVFNPSRSVRAYHLHRSLVRRYTAEQRLVGPVLSIASTALATPWVSFVVPCMGRLSAVESALRSLAVQRRSSCYLVDYSCPDGVEAWVREHQPAATVVRVPGRRRYHAAEALNRGADAAEDDAILCFLDPDVVVTPDFSDRILADLPEHGFLVPDPADAEHGAADLLVCRKSDFRRAGGYDEVLLDPGSDHADLAHRLRLAGLQERRFPRALVSRVAGGGGSHPWVLGDAATSTAVQAAYCRAKAAILAETGATSPPASALREIYRTIARHALRERGLTPNVPGAEVAFGETMGYAVASLETGVSSHTNDVRPLAAIPAPLAGKPFTQVVAYHVSPIDVEFLTPGKLYVLVGTDWYGYGPLTQWLSSAGYREPLPALTTARGTTFEVWSVVGDAGERLVIPTQVMLVAEQLRRRA
jgi:hypothetical protein